MLSYDKSPAAYHGPVSQYSSSTPSLQRLGRKMQQPDRHVFVVYGPAGCGKTTVAQYLAKEFGYSYIEGDDFHPRSNVEKMAAGIPLQDADRWDWLINLREEAINRLESGAQGVVMTCSALKKKYRDVIRIASINDHDVHVHFLCLHADRDTLIRRVTRRTAETEHFMGAQMVDSQLKDFEPMGSRETDISLIDVRGTMSDNEQAAAAAVVAILSS